jgi:hypothetical protein
MVYFKGIARNVLGYTFSVYFYHYNWNGIQEVAEKALALAVQNDSLHQKCGPWTISNIDRAA